MPGGFPANPELCQFGMTFTSWQGSNGELINLSSAIYPAFGAWTQIISSAAIDISELTVVFGDGGNGFDTAAINIGIGASGSELILVPNLTHSGALSTVVRLPVSIPAGTRISAQCSYSSSINLGCGMMYAGDGAYEDRVSCAFDSIGGLSGAAHGTSISGNATANLFGAYTQLTAASINDYAGFLVICDDLNGSATNASSLVKIAIGASGSEKDVWTGIGADAYRSKGDSNGGNLGNSAVWTPIPAGTRISAAICANASSAVLGVSLIGIRK